MTTLNLIVGAGADDGYWTSGGSFDAAATFLVLGQTSTRFNSFARFTNVTVDNSATINSAVITVRASSSLSGATVKVILKALAEDDATAPTSAADANARTRTTANSAWNPVPGFSSGTDYNSPDCAGIIQEVVDRAGWGSGNAVVIYFEDNASSFFAYRYLSSYEASTSFCPRLDIDYTAGGGGGGGSIAAISAYHHLVGGMR